MFKFLTSKTFLALFALALAAGVAPGVFAQTPQSAATTNRIGVEALGPFGDFLVRAANLFSATRYAIYVCAAFAFVTYAWTAITKGEFEKDKLFWLLVALILLGIAGSLVDWLVGTGDYTTGEFGGFGNVKGAWSK